MAAFMLFLPLVLDVAVGAKAKGCLHPGGIDDGQAYPTYSEWKSSEGKPFKRGDTIKYVCDKGYELKANGGKKLKGDYMHITCSATMADGDILEWLPQVPSCVVIYQKKNDCGKTTGVDCVAENPGWKKLEGTKKTDNCAAGKGEFGEVKCTELDPYRQDNANVTAPVTPGTVDFHDTSERQTKVTNTMNALAMEKEVKKTARKEAAANKVPGEDLKEDVRARVNATTHARNTPVISKESFSSASASAVAESDDQDDEDKRALNDIDMDKALEDLITNEAEEATAGGKVISL